MNKSKLLNKYTINFDDDIKNMIEFIADSYQRKPAELLRLLLTPTIQNEFIKLMQEKHPENKNGFKRL